MKKRVTYERLKVGQKFRYNRKLYVKDKMHCGVCLSNGHIPSDKELPDDALVTPVKVQIRVIG